ncbi:MAG: pyridoxamine 5'-phosphate oxidase family protein [Gammaproteobacteria bacterium]
MGSLSESEVQRIIDGAYVARLAQLDTKNDVHAIPFVFVRYEDSLYSPVDGKPKRHAKLSRLEWIKSAPKVCVLIDEYSKDWTELWWLRLYGEATQIGSDHGRWDTVSTSLVEKYPQYKNLAMFSGEPTMMRIKITRWRYWSAAK